MEGIVLQQRVGRWWLAALSFCDAAIDADTLSAHCCCCRLAVTAGRDRESPLPSHCAPCIAQGHFCTGPSLMWRAVHLFKCWPTVLRGRAKGQQSAMGTQLSLTAACKAGCLQCS